MAKGTQKSMAKGSAKAEGERRLDYLRLPSLERVLWYAFIKAYKVVVDNVDRELRDKEMLSLAEYEIVAMVHNAGGRLRFIDLAKVTLLSQSRISRQVDALQAKGLLRREITDTDRRATYAIITPLGKEVLRRSDEGVVEALQHHFFGRVPDPAHPQFLQMLEHLLDPGYSDVNHRILDEARIANGLPPFKDS